MTCKNCNTEHNGKFCPNCGAPSYSESIPSNSTNPTEITTPPKKPITKRWWFWAIAVILLIALLGNLGGKDDIQQEKSITNEVIAEAVNANVEEREVSTTPEPTAVPTPTASPEPTIDLSAVLAEYTLTAGNYVAGIDIPAGKCAVAAVSGQGNLISSNMFSGGINEMFGVDDGTGFYTSEFNGLKLPEGTVLSVGGTVIVKLVYSTIESSFLGRTYDESNAFEMNSGNYEAGIDFEAGVYKIIAISGTGNISSDNMFSGGLNEIFGIDKGYGFYVKEFTNADLPSGTVLTVSGGLKIKLIPAYIN